MQKHEILLIFFITENEYTFQPISKYVLRPIKYQEQITEKNVFPEIFFFRIMFLVSASFETLELLEIREYIMQMRSECGI